MPSGGTSRLFYRQQCSLAHGRGLAQNPRILRNSPLGRIFSHHHISSLSPFATVMDLDAIPNFLGEQRDAAPADIQHVYLTFEDLWERKLWHELTNALLEFFQSPESAPQRLAIYSTFILSFADKINQLKLVSLGLQASTQCRGELRARPIL
jgi:hypothetical protein